MFFEEVMGLDDDQGGCRLEAHTALYADDGVPDVGVAADGPGGGDLLQLLNDDGTIADFLTIDGPELPFFEGKFQVTGS